MKLRWSLFARVAATLAIALLGLQLLLLALYLGDRGEGEEPGYRFPLPERVLAMAALIETTPDEALVLTALNTGDVRVSLSDGPLAALTEPDTRLAQVERVMTRYADALEGRAVAAFIALPGGVTEAEIRPGDRSLWSDHPLRILVALRDGRVLAVETRDDLLTKIYAVPIGFWAGVFAFLSGLVVLLVLRRETRPLARLSRAARQFGDGGVPVPVPPQGAPEIRALIDAFNGMQTRIDDLLTRRKVMLGALGHDLRTYLTRLSLKIDDLPDTIRPGLERDVARMGRILESCLDLAREGGQAADAVALRPFLGALIGDWPEGQVDLAPIPDLPPVAFAAPDLERVLTNLIDNALKYGGSARLSATPKGDAVALTVADDGPGLSPADLTRVLQPFETGDAARTLGRGGAGLGLAIAKTLAERNGASLTLTSPPGGGLCATLILRVASHRVD